MCVILSNIKNYIALCFRILNCIQYGLVLNHEFDVEFNVRRNSYFISIHHYITSGLHYDMVLCNADMLLNV